MRLLKWIESLYAPEKTNFKDAGLDDLMTALANESVRKRWMDKMMDELRAINIGIDKNLEDGTLGGIEARAIRRRTIILILNQILESSTEIETDLYEQAHPHNNPKQSNGPSWFGRTVPLDERVDNSKEPTTVN